MTAIRRFKPRSVTSKKPNLFSTNIEEDKVTFYYPGITVSSALQRHIIRYKELYGKDTLLYPETIINDYERLVRLNFVFAKNLSKKEYPKRITLNKTDAKITALSILVHSSKNKFKGEKGIKLLGIIQNILI